MARHESATSALQRVKALYASEGKSKEYSELMLRLGKSSLLERD